jgi:hypothetical protein
MDTIEQEIIATVQVGGGYFDTDELTYPADSMAVGSENVFIVDHHAQKIFKGLTANGTGGRTMFNVAGGYASLNDNGGTDGVGSIFNFINESLFAIGGGKARFNGTLLQDSAVDLVVTSTLQLAPKVGAYTYPEWYTAGFSQPTAPTVVARDPTLPLTGLCTGTYSFKIAAVRSTTGARSIASPTSAVIGTTGQTIHLTFPTAATNGQDRWAIFGTKAGFGGVGVHYLIKEINESDLSTVDSIARSYVLEYNDSDLLAVTAYTDDYPPQAALFAARLENYVLTFGAYGNAIQCSVRNFPESFNPEHLGFLPKPPTAILQDPQGSYIYVSTNSSVHAVSVVPSVDNPLIIQTLWADVGVDNPHNWCTVQGVLFAFTKKTGAVTMGNSGSPSSEFAIPVAKAMRGWVVDDVVVHSIPHLNSVAYSYQGDSYLFNLQTLKWSSPARLNDFFTGNVVSALVVDRKPYVTLNNAGTFTLYEFDNGSTQTDFAIVSPDNVPYPAGRVNILGLRTYYSAAAAYTSFTFDTKIRTDFSGTADKTLSHQPVAGMNVTKRSRWYLARRNALAIEFTGSQTDFTGDCFLSHVCVYGTYEDSTLLT